MLERDREREGERIETDNNFKIILYERRDDDGLKIFKNLYPTRFN